MIRIRRKFQIAATLTWAIFVAAMVGIVASWSGRAREEIYTDRASAAVPSAPSNPNSDWVAYSAPRFDLIDQNRTSIANDALKGQPYVAILFFTTCNGPCPMMIGKMLALQRTVPDSRVKLVAFTVDPKHDTPEVLKTYADAKGCDASRWHFLTGEEDAIVKVAKGLHLAYTPATPEQPLQHASQFMLIDATGNVVGAYDSVSEQQMKQLTHDAAALAR